VKVGTGHGPVVGCFEHGIEPSGSIKVGKFLDQLSYYQLLKKNFAVSSWIINCCT
jgi:hypothetical protein